MKGLKGITSFMFLFLLFATIFFSPLPALATTLNIQPAFSTPNLGSSFDVFVSISDVTNLYSFQFAITFNPAIISGLSVSEGPFLPSGDPTSTFFVPGSIDNNAGTISITVDTLLGPPPGVNGSGTLADISFQALASGTSPIDLSEVLLLTPNPNDPENPLDNPLPIIATIESGSVTVASAVPEPSTILLISMGMVALGIVRKKGQATI